MNKSRNEGSYLTFFILHIVGISFLRLPNQILYILGLFFLGALLGWFMNSYTILSTRDKRQKFVAITTFLFIMTSLLIMLSIIFSTSITFSLSFVENGISYERRGDVACLVDATYSCSNCDNTNDNGRDRCPEWSSDDVEKVLQGQAKACATLAGICIVYTILALRFGINLLKYLSNYQIEYV